MDTTIQLTTSTHTGSGSATPINFSSERYETSSSSVTIRWLSMIQSILVLLCFCGGLAETMIKCPHVTQSYADDEYQTVCVDVANIGQGMWCSIIPFAAAMWGLSASGTSPHSLWYRVYTGLCYVGSVSMGTLTLIEKSLMIPVQGYYHSLQIAISCASITASVLLFLSGCLSLFVSWCCEPKTLITNYEAAPPMRVGMRKSSTEHHLNEPSCTELTTGNNVVVITDEVSFDNEDYLKQEEILMKYY